MGNPCRAAATAGGLCFFHSNPAKASELGRIGGRRNRHVAAEPCTALPPVDSARGIREAVTILVNDVYAGKLNPKTAAVITPLLKLLLQATEASDIESKVTHLEYWKGKLEGEGDALNDRGD